jgi:catecholate siderophore receptor
MTRTELTRTELTSTERRAQERKLQKEAKKSLRKSDERGSRAALSGTRVLIAAGALAAYAALGSGRPAFAAVTPAYPSNPDGPFATLPLKKFDIPAGPLDAAIAAYEQVAGVTVRIDVPKDTLAGFQTKGVKGLYRPEEALSLLLEGTGLQFAMLPGANPQDQPIAAIGLRREDTVSVTTELPDGVTMSQFTEPLLDTPQTVVAIPQFVLKDEQNTSLRDALRNVPGISMAAGEFGAQGDNLTIRGFTARNDIFLDGIRDFGSYYRDSFS